MRLAWLAFGVALAGFVVFPGTEAGAAAAGLIAVALLVLLGYRDGTWSGLRWTLIVPAAAVVADVLTFTPLSLHPETEPPIWTYLAGFYFPAWVLLVAGGIGARRLQRRRRPSSSTPTGAI
jgi:hypothetical protein